MLKEFRKEITWGGRVLSLESGKIARQADGAVLATLGETKVLCTVAYEKTPKASLFLSRTALSFEKTARNLSSSEAFFLVVYR